MYPAAGIALFKASRIRQIRAQPAGNGRSPDHQPQRRAGESGGLLSGEALWGRLWRCAFLKRGAPFPRTRDLQLPLQRFAEWGNIRGGVH